MYKSEIKVGKMFTNGKQRETIRKVVKFSENPWYMYFKTIKGFPGNDRYAVLKSSFAKWAVAEVKEGEDEKS